MHCSALAAAALCNTATAATACVWRVVNAPAPFYLCGTIPCTKRYTITLCPKPYDQALKGLQRLLFEIDPHPKRNFNHKFVRAAVYPERRQHSTPCSSARPWEYLAKNFQDLELGGPQKLAWGDCFLTISSRCGRGRSHTACGRIHGYNDVFSNTESISYLELSGTATWENKSAASRRTRNISKCCAGWRTLMRSSTLLDAMVQGDKRRDELQDNARGLEEGQISDRYSLTRSDREN